jgi:hypothetical protein
MGHKEGKTLTSKKGGKTTGFSLDMTKATTLEPFADGTRTLVAISQWSRHDSSTGNPTLHVEATIIKPETAGIRGRKYNDEINLVNEFTLGRLLLILKGLGYKEEDIRKKDFNLPEEDDVKGLQMTVIAGIRKDATYGDRNTMKRILPAEDFEKASY